MINVYVSQGGAPDKAGMTTLFEKNKFSNSLVNIHCVEANQGQDAVNDFMKKFLPNIKGSEFKLESYFLVCSENELQFIKDNWESYNFKDSNLIYLRAREPLVLTRKNVLMIPDKYKLKQYELNTGKNGLTERQYNDFIEFGTAVGSIAKADSSSGGRGVIASTADKKYMTQWKVPTKEYENYKKLFEPSTNYIVQELVPSEIDDYAVSVLVKDGQLYDYVIIKSMGNKFNPKWYNYIVDHRPETIAYLLPLMNDVINTFGITDGFFEIECTKPVELYDYFPKVIEINPRYSWTTSMSRYMIVMDRDRFAPLYHPILDYFKACTKFSEIMEGRYQVMKVIESSMPVKEGTFD